MRGARKQRLSESVWSVWESDEVKELRGRRERRRRMGEEATGDVFCEDKRDGWLWSLVGEGKEG